jgi:hypothetical protein
VPELQIDYRITTTDRHFIKIRASLSAHAKVLAFKPPHLAMAESNRFSSSITDLRP